MKHHGGRVWAEGAIGKGATFYFSYLIRSIPCETIIKQSLFEAAHPDAVVPDRRPQEVLIHSDDDM